MALSPKTLQLIKEAFGNQECRFCKAPATRMHRKFYYCIDCFPGKKRKYNSVAISEIHDYRRKKSIRDD